MNNKQLTIDDRLVCRLVATQFPQWKDLPVRPVAQSGWDNRTFHVGEQMLVRMPSAEDYATQVEKEHRWLPKLAPLLPLPIPVPLAIGEPAEGYPWKWSIYRWLKGDTAASAPITNSRDFANSTTLSLDSAIWERGLGWTLWKALIICAATPGTNPLEVENSRRIIDEILADHNQKHQR